MMTTGDLATLATNFGGMGFLFGYVIWRDLRRDRLDDKRINADLQQATALAMLTEAIKGLRR